MISFRFNQIFSNPLAFKDVAFYKSEVLTDSHDEAPIYTYKFTRGVSNSSHGLLVAKMADIPEDILDSAALYLKNK